MLYLWSVILILLNACWLVLVLFGLPGNWLIVISTSLFAWWWAEDAVFSLYTIIGITILAILGELVEFLGGLGGAKKAGAGWRGSLGALIGAVTGAILGTFVIPIPFFGTLIGACVGAGLGAWALESAAGQQIQKSARFGLGASLGVLLGTTTKFVIGMLIWLIVAVAAFWP